MENCPVVVLYQSDAYYNVMISCIIPDCCLFLFAVLFQVYSWGCNNLGQLGHMNSLNTVPQYIKVLYPSLLSLALKHCSMYSLPSCLLNCCRCMMEFVCGM